MKVDTKAAREFSEGGDRYTGAEVRLWVHNLCDEVDKLRAQLEVAKAACEAAVSKAQWQAVTNRELNELQAEIRRLRGVDA